MMKNKLIIGVFAALLTTLTAGASEALLNTGKDRTNDSVAFTFQNLPEHSEINLNFDLFLLESWDGNDSTYGIDVFGFKIDGAEQSWTFRNASQDPGDESNIDSTWNTGNFNGINTWGEIDRHFVNYADGFTVAHTGSALNLEFFGAGLLDINDESWRVENISLKTVSLIPEKDQAIFIERLYLSVLDRRADQEEMDRSLNVIQTDSGAKVAHDLFQSQEFIDLQLSDADFIHTLHETLFDRSPAQEELDEWTQELEYGKLREMVAYDFLRNQEFKYLVNSFDAIAFNEADNTTFQIKSFVQRFYQLVLNREPDIAGFSYWVSQLADSSEAGGDIAKGFFQSTEFINRQATASDFLDIAYRSFFNREADLEGKQYWKSKLDSGETHLAIVNGFIGSQEFIDLANSFGIAASNDGDNQIKSFVKRFYRLVLDREADAAGFNYWSAQLIGGGETGGDIARGFFESAEFINRQVPNSEFMDIAYHAFFNRHADSDGKKYWMNALSAGISRQDIVNGFIDSQEFTALAKQFGIKAD